MRNLRIGVNKLVGKVLINLLRHAVSRVYNQHNYGFAYYSSTVEVVQLNKSSVFVTTAALLCQCVVVNKQM